MRQTLRAALFFAALLLPGMAHAQCSFPTPIPANTVIGRLGIGPGPCQAIPISAVAGPAVLGNSFTQFTGPLAPTKTFTLPNVSGTLAMLSQIQTWSAAQTFLSSLSVNGALSATGGGALAGTFSGTPAFSGPNFITFSNLANYTQTANGTGVARPIQTKLDDALSVKDYGVKCDGSTDDTTNIGTADAAAAAVGKALRFPGGTCVVSSPIAPAVGCHWIGDGYAATVIETTSPTANVLNVSNGFCTFENLQIQASVTRTAGAYFNVTASNFAMRHVQCQAPFTCLNVNGGGGVGVTLLDVESNNAVASTGVDFDISNCTNCQWSQVTSSNASGSRPFGHLVLRNVSDLHCYDCNYLQGTNDIYITPGNGQSVNEFDMIGGYADTAGSNSIAIAPTGTGIVGKIHLLRTWIVTSVTSAIGLNIAPANTASVDLVECVDCIFLGTGAPNGTALSVTQASGTSVKNVVLDHGCIAAWGNGVNANAAGSIYINDVIFGNCGLAGINTTGVALAGAIGTSKMHDNIFTGSTTSVSNAATITTCNWHDNLGLDPVGTGAITVTASPFTYTAGCSPETVYIANGTVSNVANGGVNIFSITNTTVDLDPQGTVAVTYSSTPTMNKRIH